MKLPRHVEHFDDERAAGNSVIVTLHYGWSFEPHAHEGVRGFDTIREALAASSKREIYQCRCDECVAALAD